jgi:hypothetical protein
MAGRKVIDLEAPDQQRLEGSYFAKYENFWNVESTKIYLNDFDALGSIRRTKMPKMYEPAFSAEQLEKDLTQFDRAGTSENSSEASNSSETGAQTDLLGHEYPVYEKAHMIPDAVVGSRCYGFIAEAALGLRNSSAETRLKLVKGVDHTVGNNGKIQRVKQSGLKHNKYNKLRLKYQKIAIDESPFLLIIPILPLSEVLDWDESNAREDFSYDVMICASASAPTVRVIYKELFHDHRGLESECTPQDIQTATQLLSTFARAIASSTFNDSIMESMTSTNNSVANVANVVGRIDRASQVGHAEVDLPVLNTDVVDLENPAAMEGVRVVKARVTKRTSLPDPYLVAVKAAANWFSGRGQKMFAAASVYDSGSDTDSSGYNDMQSSPPRGFSDDPLVNLRNSLSSSSHVTVELFSIDPSEESHGNN